MCALFDRSGAPTTAFAGFLRTAKIPGEDIVSINNALQARFFQKDDKGLPKERWELDAVAAEPKEILWDSMRTIGLIDAVPVSQRRYEGVFVFGALLVRIRTRMRTVRDLWEIGGVRFSSVVLLGGKRDVMLTDPKDPRKPGRESEYDIRASGTELPARNGWKWDGNIPKTEHELMQFVWKQADLQDDLRTIPVVAVDAPMQTVADGIQRRPSTADTIRTWLEVHRPKAGLYLAVSNQPHVGYQQAVLRNTLPDGIVAEVVGAKASDTLPIEFYMGELARWVHEEAAYWEQHRAFPC